ncbi:MAG TPA: glycosyltransferase family 2 protein [Bryobacteraceae bacterium]|nr:glycosyltransferase family 2 protein [Bryobacteraceae bacterium]
MNSNPQVSIVAACRNESLNIRAFLESVLKQEMAGIEWEAVIADGMSNDGTREFLLDTCRQHPQLHLIDNPGLIVSTGLNRAIRMARGEIIVRMDAHTKYAPDYVRRCLEALQQTGADNVGGPARTKARGARARAIAAAFHSKFSTGGGKFHDENFEGWVDTVPYGCWRKSTLDELGLFDESLVRNQDDELNLRLRRAGGRIWQTPKIVSWYSPRATLASLFQQYFQYGFWKVAVIRKHRLPGSWRHLVPCAFVASNLLLGAILAAAAASEFGAAANWAALAWLGLILCYCAATLVASLAAAACAGWVVLAYLPAAFLAYHAGYGLGFLVGIVTIRRGRAAGWNGLLVTRITR